MLFKARNKILYKDWIWEWLSYKKDYIKESTYANYSNIITNHIIPDLGKYYLNQLSNKIIQKFLLEKYKNGRLDHSGGLSAKTIRDIIAIIKSSLKSAFKENLIQNLSLDFIYPKTNQKDKIYTLSKHSQEKLTNYILENKTIKNLGILLTLYSGIRIGELCALQWKDIDFNNHTVKIYKQLNLRGLKRDNLFIPTKNNIIRIISIPNKLWDMIITQYKKSSKIIGFNNEFFVFGDDKYMAYTTIDRKKDYYFNLSKVKRITMHQFRHSHASLLISNNIPLNVIAKRLGDTPDVVLKTYAHLFPQKEAEVLNVLNGI